MSMNVISKATQQHLENAHHHVSLSKLVETFERSSDYMADHTVSILWNFLPHCSVEGNTFQILNQEGDFQSYFNYFKASY